MRKASPDMRKEDMKPRKKALSMVNGFVPMIVPYLMLESPSLETSLPLSFTTMMTPRLTMESAIKIYFKTSSRSPRHI